MTACKASMVARLVLFWLVNDTLSFVASVYQLTMSWNQDSGTPHESSNDTSLAAILLWFVKVKASVGMFGCSSSSSFSNGCVG